VGTLRLSENATPDPPPMKAGTVGGMQTRGVGRRLRELVWWAEDYVYAAVWQVRATFDRSDPLRFLDGVGTPIVVLPGVYETWRFLQPLIGAVHERGHPVHVVTAARRNSATVVRIADQVAAYLAEHDLNDVVLVAHSKGGLVGKQVMLLPEAAGRIRGMVAVATPFGGSRYARLMLGRTLRSFSPTDASIRALQSETGADARIVSVYARFDPHIPEGSALAGAKNVEIDTGGHFRILADPRVIAEVAAMAQ
jgi:predicted alpha/beta hydrolase family esterase